MAAYVISDVQGCHFSFLDLLDSISFNKKNDQLIFVGDLVNRGKNSRKFIKWCFANRLTIKSVLGNHDLHFLAVFFGIKKLNNSDTLSKLLKSKDVDNYVDWLLSLPLALRFDDCLIVHAGIHPNWSLQDSLQYSEEVSKSLKKNPYKFLSKMYGNNPGFWAEDLKKNDRRRMIVNIFTRMRMLNKDLSLDYEYKGDIPNNHGKSKPWFSYRNQNKDIKIISGHWSAIDIQKHQYGFSIDSGCVWGGSLTALRLSDLKIFQAKANPKDLCV
jgi:bis(5'-nucleosyl)-tetraphosphatase (symmetrical)